MKKYRKLLWQPEVRYAAGLGIGRSNCPEEWTSVKSGSRDNVTEAEWEEWRQKALAGCRWRNCRDLIKKEDGNWYFVFEPNNKK